MALNWCTESDIKGNLADYENWAKNTINNVNEYIAGASGEAASYLMRYREFFSQWNSGQAPKELRDAVAVIAVKKITGANATLAPQDIDKTYWEREYERVLKWLSKLQDGEAELYVEWANVPTNEQGNRAKKYINTKPAKFT